jgi:RNA-binding protein
MQDATPLSSAEKKELRGMAQRLKAQVHVGKNGLTENVLAEIGTALLKNGLIKVRFESDRSQHKELERDITHKLNCECVGSVGKSFVFFKEMPVKEATN